MFKKLVCLFLCILGCTSAAPGSQSSKQNELIQLGTSGNITFYAGREEINWEAGKQLCLANNMTFAEVHLVEQEEFLKTALTDLNEFSHYFTAGRTRVGLDSLVWDGSLSAMNPSMNVQVDELETRCLLIRVPDYATLWETDPCTDQWPPLCQSAQ